MNAIYTNIFYSFLFSLLLSTERRFDSHIKPSRAQPVNPQPRLSRGLWTMKEMDCGRNHSAQFISGCRSFRGLAGAVVSPGSLWLQKGPNQDELSSCYHPQAQEYFRRVVRGMLPPLPSLGYFPPSGFGDPQPELAKGRVRTLPKVLKPNHIVKPQQLLPSPSAQI